MAAQFAIVKNKAAMPADSTSAASCNSQGFRHAPVAALAKEYIDCRNAYKGRDVSCWHEAEMPKYLGKVRYWMNSGKHLLPASISEFDPSATLVVRCTDGLDADFFPYQSAR